MYDRAVIRQWVGERYYIYSTANQKRGWYRMSIPLKGIRRDSRPAPGLTAKQYANQHPNLVAKSDQLVIDLVKHFPGILVKVDWHIGSSLYLSLLISHTTLDIDITGQERVRRREAMAVY